MGDKTRTGRNGCYVLLALLLLTPAANAAPHLDRQAIRRTVKRDITKIMTCYEMHDLHTPRIVLAFTIGTSGRVASLTITGGAKPLKDCVAGVFMRMKFPPAKDVTRVTYPLQICTAGS